MIFSLSILSLLSAVAFSAGFIDSIAGGGGLLMVPALLMAGLPPQLALGTNKFSSTLGTSMAVANFIHRKKVVFKIVGIGLFFTLLGGFLGGKAILALDPSTVGKVIVGLLPVGIAAVLVPKKNSVSKPPAQGRELWVIVPLICLILGFYDGFFGPGAGSFLALGFHFLLRLDLVQSTANAKVFNFLSNLSALTAFLMAGKVIFSIGLPMAVCAMGGNYIGSHLAIKKGDRFIRFCLIGVLFLLLISLAAKYF